MMITLLAIWGWLLVGATIGRAVFVHILGDRDRRGLVDRKDQYNRRYTVENGWTGPFTRAVRASVACLVTWPVALPVILMFAHTGTEKLRSEHQRLEAERRRLEAEIAQLEKEVRDA